MPASGNTIAFNGTGGVASRRGREPYTISRQLDSTQRQASGSTWTATASRTKTTATRTRAPTPPELPASSSPSRPRPTTRVVGQVRQHAGRRPSTGLLRESACASFRRGTSSKARPTSASLLIDDRRNRQRPVRLHAAVADAAAPASPRRRPTPAGTPRSFRSESSSRSARVRTRRRRHAITSRDRLRRPDDGDDRRRARPPSSPSATVEHHPSAGSPPGHARRRRRDDAGPTAGTLSRAGSRTSSTSPRRTSSTAS